MPELIAGTLGALLVLGASVVAFALAYWVVTLTLLGGVFMLGLPFVWV
jgi:hypothetical protein